VRLDFSLQNLNTQSVGLADSSKTLNDKIKTLESMLESLEKTPKENFESSKTLIIRAERIESKLEKLFKLADNSKILNNKVGILESKLEIVEKMSKETSEFSESNKVLNVKIENAESKIEELLKVNNKKIDEDNNLEQIQFLKQENKLLLNENKQLKLEIRNLKQELTQSKKVPSINDTVDHRDDPKEEGNKIEPPIPAAKTSTTGQLSEVSTISTSNRFSVLGEVNVGKIKSHNIELIIDSHGNGLQAEKIYKNKDFNVSILGPSKKNIEGAREFIESHSSPKDIVFGVGNNDLANKPVEKCISDKRQQEKMNALYMFFHALSAVKEFCESQSKVHYIRNSESITSKFENAFMEDGVRFNTTGQGALGNDHLTNLKGGGYGFFLKKYYDLEGKEIK